MKLSLNSELVNVRVDLTESQIVGLVKAAIDMAAEGSVSDGDEDPEEAIVIHGFAPGTHIEPPDTVAEDGEPDPGESEVVPEQPEEPESAPAPAEVKPVPKKAAADENAVQDATGYTGFLHMVCGTCGETKTFCAKHPIKFFRCDHGHRSSLPEACRKAYFPCECGKYWRYHTNAQGEIITIPCVHCGTPTDLMWNEKKQHYQKII